jgi:hypothetical protein
MLATEKLEPCPDQEKMIRHQRYPTLFAEKNPEHATWRMPDGRNPVIPQLNFPCPEMTA